MCEVSYRKMTTRYVQSDRPIMAYKVFRMRKADNFDAGTLRPLHRDLPFYREGHDAPFLVECPAPVRFDKYGRCGYHAFVNKADALAESAYASATYAPTTVRRVHLYGYIVEHAANAYPRAKRIYRAQGMRVLPGEITTPVKKKKRK